jgi:hypothetical protein
MNYQYHPFVVGDALPQKFFEYLMRIFNIEAMQIDMALNCKISAMEPPGNLGMSVTSATFHIFGSIGYHKTAALFDELIELQDDFGVTIGLRSQLLMCSPPALHTIVPRYFSDIRHGFLKQIQFPLRRSTQLSRDIFLTSAMAS